MLSTLIIVASYFISETEVQAANYKKYKNMHEKNIDSIYMKIFWSNINKMYGDTD